MTKTHDLYNLALRDRDMLPTIAIGAAGTGKTLNTSSDFFRVFSCDPCLGKLFWAVKPSIAVPIGREAGSSYNGILRVTFNGKNYYVHRILSVMYGLLESYDSDLVVDHIDNNQLNNSSSNLRACTQAENSLNCRKSLANSSGVKGVSFDKESGKWAAYVQTNGKLKKIGRYANIEDAAKAVRSSRETLHGEYHNHG